MFNLGGKKKFLWENKDFKELLIYRYKKPKQILMNSCMFCPCVLSFWSLFLVISLSYIISLPPHCFLKIKALQLKSYWLANSDMFTEMLENMCLTSQQRK